MFSVYDTICDMPQPTMNNRSHLTFPEKLLKEAEEKSMELEFVTCVHFKWFRNCFLLFMEASYSKIVLRGPFRLNLLH